MRIINRAFTLAELLIVIGIIGVVSAIMLPALFKNSKNNISGVALSRAIEIIETDMSNVISRGAESMIVNNSQPGLTLAAYQVNDIIPPDPNQPLPNAELAESYNFIERTYSFNDFVPMDNVNNYLAGVTTYPGNALFTTIYAQFTSWHVYQLKNQKAFVIVQPINIPANAVLNDNSILTRVFIDINGRDNPNRVGIDIFQFGLTNNGHLIPAGMQEYLSNLGIIAEQNLGLYTVNCIRNNIPTGRECAASVAANRWRITYTRQN